MWLSRFASAAVAGHRDDPFYEPEKGGEDEELKVRLKTDPHAPANFRAIGAPSNLPAFAAAFGCKEGDAMVRTGDDHIVIW